MNFVDTAPAPVTKPVQTLPLLAALVGFVAVVALSTPHGGVRYGVASFLGLLAGFTLYHAAFGFTAAWRNMVTQRRGQGVRAQMLLLAGACALTFPLIAYGPPVDDVGLRSGAWVLPFGVRAAIGAFIFGVGMQLGGGCGSGTLFTVGGGSTRMVITLAFFIVGSLIGTWHLPAWSGLPSLPAFSVVREYGPLAGWLLIAAVCGAIWWVSRRVERSSHGALEPPRQGGSWLTGPWSHTLGVVGLIIVSVATILTLGRPWGITSGFALWGAKIATSMGMDVTAWPYWSGGRARAIERSVFADATSVMNFALISGAMAAAALAARFAPVWKLTFRDVATAVVGGLLLGYGARLAYGCNIGAYLGGIVSGSLHGWLWGIFAFAGSSLMALGRKRFNF